MASNYIIQLFTCVWLNNMKTNLCIFFLAESLKLLIFLSRYGFQLEFASTTTCLCRLLLFYSSRFLSSRLRPCMQAVLCTRWFMSYALFCDGKNQVFKFFFHFVLKLKKRKTNRKPKLITRSAIFRSAETLRTWKKNADGLSRFFCVDLGGGGEVTHTSEVSISHRFVVNATLARLGLSVIFWRFVP